jgi:hypothetical protein
LRKAVEVEYCKLYPGAELCKPRKPDEPSLWDKAFTMIGNTAIAGGRAMASAGSVATTYAGQAAGEIGQAVGTVTEFGKKGPPLQGQIAAGNDKTRQTELRKHLETYVGGLKAAAQTPGLSVEARAKLAARLNQVREALASGADPENILRLIQQLQAQEKMLPGQELIPGNQFGLTIEREEPQ